MYSHLEVDATPGVGVSCPQTRMRMWVAGLSSENLPLVCKCIKPNPLGSRRARKWLRRWHYIWEEHYEESRASPASVWLFTEIDWVMRASGCVARGPGRGSVRTAWT